MTSNFVDAALIKNELTATDTAVITVSFGDEPARVRANALGIEKQLQQDLSCDVYLVELLCEWMKAFIQSLS